MELSPLFSSSGNVHVALSAVALDLQAVKSAMLSGTDALRSASTRPAACNGPSEFSACLDFLTGRTEALTTQLQALEKVTVDCISFEELLGHCKAAYQANQQQADRYTEKLEQFGYRPQPKRQHSPWDELSQLESNAAGGDSTSPLESYSVSLDVSEERPSVTTNSSTPAPEHERVSHLPVRATEAPQLLTLHDLGLSDTTMTLIGRSDTAAGNMWDLQAPWSPPEEENSTSELYRQVINKHHTPKAPTPWKAGALPDTAVGQGDVKATVSSHRAAQAAKPEAVTPASAVRLGRSHMARPQSSIRKPLTNVNYSELAQRSALKKHTPKRGQPATIQPVSAAEFKEMPPFLSARITLEQLTRAIERINGLVADSCSTEISPEQLESLALGSKCQAVLGCLVRMDRVLLETANGGTVYKVLT